MSPYRLSTMPLFPLALVNYPVAVATSALNVSPGFCASIQMQATFNFLPPVSTALVHGVAAWWLEGETENILGWGLLPNPWGIGGAVPSLTVSFSLTVMASSGT
jgi:hypothetical protein